MNNDREQFEAWLRKKWTSGYGCEKFPSGEYINPAADAYWGCWVDSRAATVAEPSDEAASYKRMFEDAVRSLAAIDEALGIDPDEAGGAEPILQAIEELKAAQQQAEPVGDDLVLMQETGWINVAHVLPEKGRAILVTNNINACQSRRGTTNMWLVGGVFKSGDSYEAFSDLGRRIENITHWCYALATQSGQRAGVADGHTNTVYEAAQKLRSLAADLPDAWLRDEFAGIADQIANLCQMPPVPSPHSTNVIAGWKLVPIEPTDEMLNAGSICHHLNETWAQMLAAAPTQQQERSDE